MRAAPASIIAMIDIVRQNNRTAPPRIMMQRLPSAGARLALLSSQPGLPSRSMACFAAQDFTGGGGTTKSGLKRCAFTLQFDTKDLGGYLRDHEAVWPEMQEALAASGWHNYSLFYRPDGFAFGYFETESSGFEEACANMDGHDVNTRWQQAMSKYTPANLSPIDTAGTLEHYFYLGDDRVLDATSTPSPPPFTVQDYTGASRTAAGLKRCCFQMKYNTEEMAQYLRDHEAVWPEMQEALAASGWHNYSLFYRPDGFAFGYFETETSGFEEASVKMKDHHVYGRWKEAMSKYTPATVLPKDAHRCAGGTSMELTH
eukprot:SAG31_NODE_1155_length_9624_cov_3.380157_5_plen_315_part_00